MASRPLTSQPRQAFDLLLPLIKRALERGRGSEDEAVLAVSEAYDLLNAFALLTGRDAGWVGQRLLRLRQEQEMPVAIPPMKPTPVLRSDRDLPRAEMAALLDLAEGLTVQQSALKHGVGSETAKTYRSRVMKRLDARNGPHAVKIAYDLGLMAELATPDM